MQTWIFQANPDEFDIDAYLASRPAQVPWLVTRYASEIAVGDRVYFWRNQGKQDAIAGIIAEGIVTTAPELREEDRNAVPFWRTAGPRSSVAQVRTVMYLVRVAKSREVLRRDWCLEDPILRNLANLRMAAGTNFPTTPEQALRLDALWCRTGRDWTRSEAVAGLMAYAETYGHPVSRLPSSPVARVALTIGRAVSGVYIKVMNFRSLDPRASGEGMSGASDTDRAVWHEFYDPASSSLRMEALSTEFMRLWDTPPNAHNSIVTPVELAAKASSVMEEAETLETLNIDELLVRYKTQADQTSTRPARKILSARSYERNPLVIAIARLRASHRCEVRNCTHPIFRTPEGIIYAEVHHIVPLADGGEDSIDNVACLCPAHHREVHLGMRSAELTEQLIFIRRSDLSLRQSEAERQS
jgi:5-methylcytosine-specific restriction endonuclease McrA